MSEEVRESVVFHAGTTFDAEGRTITDGGRLLGVTALGQDIAEARSKAYSDVKRIQYNGRHYRTDIAEKALKTRSHRA